MNMNKFRTIILMLVAAVGLNSCDLFLEMPEVTGNVYKEDVFSNRKDAEGMLFRSYHRALREGLPEGWGINHGTLASLSGEIARGYSWHKAYDMAVNGPNTGSDQNAPADFDANWQIIRSCFLVIANIDMVPDEELSKEMKEYMKGEAYGLIAYRYMGMLYRWGGVPIVVKANEMSDDLNFRRGTVQETIDHTLAMIKEAEDRLPDTWVDIEPNIGEKWVGRLTKGSVLAMKARLLTFAARPLFNSAKSYAEENSLSFEGDPLMIWLGGYDEQRYRDAIDANLAVINWANQNNKRLIFTASEGNRNTYEQAIDDYGRGVSELNGPEILLAFKIANDQIIANNVFMGYYYGGYRYAEECSMRGVLSNFAKLYRDKDGNEITNWPSVGDAAPRPIAEFGEIIDNIEPRFRVDICVPGKYGRSNDGDANWNESMGVCGSFTADETIIAEMGIGNEGRGVGSPTKFYYKAGARTWFEFPLFRLAENYLHLAEAYNEIGDAPNALKYLNIIRNRAGLPAISETNKEKLREEIVREKALEFFEENHRYYDVKHWKHPEIGTKILGGDKSTMTFYRNGGTNTMDAMVSYWDSYAYTAYWHPKWFLEPFRQTEVNKGLIDQNPGY